MFANAVSAMRCLSGNRAIHDPAAPQTLAAHAPVDHADMISLLFAFKLVAKILMTLPLTIVLFSQYAFEPLVFRADIFLSMSNIWHL